VKVGLIRYRPKKVVLFLIELLWGIWFEAYEMSRFFCFKCVAMELGERNVRVNSISPGGIATGIFGKALGLPTEEAEKTAEAVKGALATLQPIRRAGLPDDIARAALFLASDESSFVNGHNLVVDGGLVGGRLWTLQQEGLNLMRATFGLST